MDGIYFFVLASVISTLGISLLVRKAMKKIVTNFNERNAILTKMFLDVGIVNIVPIIFVVYGFLNLHNSTVDLIIPICIVLLSTLLSILLTFQTSSSLSISFNISKELKSELSVIFSMGLGLILAYPIIFLLTCFLRSTF